MQDFHDQDPEAFESCFRWAFVRNPWDRIASVWSNIFFRFNNMDAPPDVAGWSGLIKGSTLKDSFVAFVNLLFDRRDLLRNLPGLRWCNLPALDLPHGRMHFFPCSALLRVNGEPRADFVGRFENLQADWEKITRRFGRNEELPRKNTHAMKFGKPHDASVMHSAGTIAKVGEIYAEDVLAFDYVTP